jgi:hypothetical protein
VDKEHTTGTCCLSSESNKKISWQAAWHIHTRQQSLGSSTLPQCTWDQIQHQMQPVLLLYVKPTHALLLNTLSHPHFKTLKLLKNVFDVKVCLKEVHELVLNKGNVTTCTVQK